MRADISPQEIARLKVARAVAKRSVMGDMAHLCDHIANEIEAMNKGRRRGSVSVAGQEMAAVARRCGDAIWAEREKIEVPEGPHVPE